MADQRKPGRVASPYVTWAACLLVLWLVLFPKGGFRLFGLPITWGYILLGILTPLAFAKRFLVMPLVFPRRVLSAILMLLPVQACFVYAGKLYGVADFNFAFSSFVGLFAMPWIFLLLFGPFFPQVESSKLRIWFCACVFYAAVWGIVLFALYPYTHHNVEIPFLTVNGADYGNGSIENGKSNARGIFLKLVSTYNNGNIYGVATLLLLPLYVRLEPARWRRGVVRLALLLTLSRTVWAGVVLNEVLSLGPPLLRQVKTFPVVYLREVRRRLLAVVFTILFVFGSVVLVTFRLGDLSFLFDRSLGNRVGQINGFTSAITFFPERPLFGFGEVLYASAVGYWGYTGLFAFTLMMVSPVLILFWTGDAFQSPVRRAALKALVIYAFMATSDGALDFIPVMAFYWFVYAIFLYGWPGTQGRFPESHKARVHSVLQPGLAS